MIPMTSNVAFAGRFPQPVALAAVGPSDADSALNELEICTRAVGARQLRTLKTGESLFLQGDRIRSICILRAGWAFRYQCLEDGRRQIVDFVLPGDVLGFGQSSRMPYGVEALAPCSWIMVDRDSFLTLLAHQPSVSMKLVDKLSAAQVRAFEHVTSVGRRTARERVAHLLLDLARRVRNSATGCEGVEISMPLVQSHIGDALGLATETVCRCLGDLKRSGILVFNDGRLEILDLEGLSEITGTLLDDEDEDAAGTWRQFAAA